MPKKPNKPKTTSKVNCHICGKRVPKESTVQMEHDGNRVRCCKTHYGVPSE